MRLLSVDARRREGEWKRGGFLEDERTQRSPLSVTAVNVCAAPKRKLAVFPLLSFLLSAASLQTCPLACMDARDHAASYGRPRYMMTPFHPIRRLLTPGSHASPPRGSEWCFSRYCEPIAIAPSLQDAPLYTTIAACLPQRSLGATDSHQISIQLR